MKPRGIIMKNILHISDLHLSHSTGKGFHTSQVEALLASLLDDLNNQFEEPIDAVFFTGDLSFSGKIDELEYVKTNFINPLLEKLNLGYSDLYVVPGNHDVSQDKVTKIEASYRANASSEELNDLSKDINENGHAWLRTDNYSQFSASLSKNVDNFIYNGALVNVRQVDKKLNIYSLNSAWIAQDKFDKGCLRVLNQLEFSLKKYGKNKTNVVLFHHPTDWFHVDEQHLISKEIERNVDALFFGHMHEFEQSITINFSQDITLRLQAGTLDQRNKKSGYSVIQLHSKNNFSYGRVFYRKYIGADKKYTAWKERGENGCFDFSIDKTQIFDAQKFSKHSIDLKETVEFDHIINTGKEVGERKSLKSIFIEPKFENDNIEKIEANVGNIKDLGELLELNGCILISGSEQNGKSFLLRYIQLYQLEKQGNSDLRHITFYLDLANHKFTRKTQVLMELIADYLGHELHTSFEGKVRSAIEAGCAKILIDNYDQSDSKSILAVNEFIKANNKNTFIISCNKSNNLDTLKTLISVYDGEKYNTCIASIARGDIRKIISSRPELSEHISEDEIFSNIIRVIDSSQLSHNHFVYSVLLSIYENKKDLVGILSESDIIENYIEILLEKHSMSTAPNKPQFQDLKHLMGFISSKMLKNKVMYLDRTEYLEYIIEFDKETMNDFQVDDYSTPLIQSGILVEKENKSIEFSNICFMHYFVAYYMNADDNLHEFIFSNDNYLHLEKVVEYFSSQNSSSFDVLDFLERKVDKLRNEITISIKENQNIDIDLLNLNDLDNISVLDLASSTDEFEEKINEYKEDRQKYDQRQDELSPLFKKGDKECDLKQLDCDYKEDLDSLNSTLRYKKELTLFSKVFRSTELLMNRTRVLTIFDKILSSYIFLIKVDISRLDDDLILPLMLPRIETEFLADGVSAEEREALIKGFKLFLSIIRASIPNIIENMMSESLATKKPRFKKILHTKLGNVTEDIDILLLRFLLLEIERKGLRNNISYLDKHSGKFASNTLFLKLIQILTSRQDLSDNDQEFIKGKITNLVKCNKEIEATGYQKFIEMIEC